MYIYIYIYICIYIIHVVTQWKKMRRPDWQIFRPENATRESGCRRRYKTSGLGAAPCHAPPAPWPGWRQTPAANVVKLFLSVSLVLS